MHHPTDRIIHTKAFVTPVVEHWLEREIAQCVHHELHLAPVSIGSYNNIQQRNEQTSIVITIVAISFNSNNIHNNNNKSNLNCLTASVTDLENLFLI